jgi:hypothetical protein
MLTKAVSGFQIALQVPLYCLVHAALNSNYCLDALFVKQTYCTPAHASRNNHFDIAVGQIAGQKARPVPRVFNYLALYYFAISNINKRILRTAAKVSRHL